MIITNHFCIYIKINAINVIFVVYTTKKIDKTKAVCMNIIYGRSFNVWKAVYSNLTTRIIYIQNFTTFVYIAEHFGIVNMFLSVSPSVLVSYHKQNGAAFIYLYITVFCKIKI